MVLGGANGSSTGFSAFWEGASYVSCSYLGGGSHLSISCSDPAVETDIIDRMLTPAQARAAGCDPITITRASDDWEADGGEADDAVVMPQMVATGEPEATYAPRTPDPAVTARVARSWDRIERWLGAHASATLRKLGDPAKPEDLAQWEATRGRRLPDALYASFRRHNGSPGSNLGLQAPPAYDLLDLYSIDSALWRRCQELILWSDARDADAENGRWHGSLVPFADSIEGRNLFIDPRTGRVGQASWLSRVNYGEPMGWPSYADLLEGLADALERGGPLRGWYPVVTAGCELGWARNPGGPQRGGCAGGPPPTPSPTPAAPSHRRWS
ncbi:hypothetical protein Skr01_57840 [Sphaerisporangium krabiense]|nr:hypothetical protein Skr01_57840 [Sphaerisporangium krabiense]